MNNLSFALSRKASPLPSLWFQQDGVSPRKAEGGLEKGWTTRWQRSWAQSTICCPPTAAALRRTALRLAQCPAKAIPAIREHFPAQGVPCAPSEGIHLGQERGAVFILCWVKTQGSRDQLPPPLTHLSFLPSIFVFFSFESRAAKPQR